MKKNEDRNKRYVVYLADLDRTKTGIYFRNVYPIRGKKQSVVQIDGHKAHILPNESIFQTEAEAQKYLAGRGTPRWVVCEKRAGSQRRQAVPAMFYGRVLRYVYGGRWRREDKTVVQDAEGNFIDVESTYSCRVFDTKKEAEAEFVHRWQANMKEAKRQLRDWSELISLLKVNPPRSRKA